MIPTRVLVTGAALCAAGVCLAVPAAAHGRPATRPTRVTVHAEKGAVAPKKQDPLVVHLATGHKGVEGEAANLTVMERSLTGSGTPRAWNDVTAGATITDGGAGKYVITGVKPNDPRATHGHKDQFQIRFAGDGSYCHSRSSVITVVVKPADQPDPAGG
jgi:hypothetical protein